MDAVLTSASMAESEQLPAAAAEADDDLLPGLIFLSTMLGSDQPADVLCGLEGLTQACQKASFLAGPLTPLPQLEQLLTSRESLGGVQFRDLAVQVGVCLPMLMGAFQC